MDTKFIKPDAHKKMAFTFKHLSYNLSLLTLILFTIFSTSTSSPFLLPALKDPAKPQYYTSFLFGTPSFRVYLSIDISNPWSWFTCHLVGDNQTFYTPVPNSSTYAPVRCVNSTCASYNSHFCYDCDFDACLKAKGESCGAEVDAPYEYTTDVSARQVSSLLLDVITIYNSNGPSPVKAQLHGFPFTCAYYSELKGLSQYTKGILGLSRKKSALPGLISKTFNVPYKFALCLPSISNTGTNGVIYFGGGPYNFQPNTYNVSKYFVTTPLVLNPVDVGISIYKDTPSVEYFINVKSIQVGGTTLKFDTKLLMINQNGIGGTKLNTIFGYTTLHSQIYNALVTTFTAKAAAMNIMRVAPVGSFGACFSSKNIVGSRTGPNVPIIDLVLDGKSGSNINSWRIYGANSMVEVSSDVRCLGFIDGGVNVKTAIVIGGKQMEDNLIEFDLESSKLGVTSSLLNHGTSCSQFKGI